MRWLVGLLCLVWVQSANAQALVVQTCGILPQTYAVGSTRPPTVDVNGRLCSTNRTAPGYLSGRFYPVGVGNTITNQAFPTLDTVVFLYPFTVYNEAVSVNSLNTVSVTGAVNCAIKMAVWANSTTTKRPTGVPLAGSNTGQACTGSPQNASIAISFTFRPGTIYWAGLAATTAAAQFVSFRSDIGVSQLGTWGQVGLTTLSQGVVTGLSAPYAYAGNIMALDLTSATFTDSTSLGIPVLYLGAQ